MPKLLSPLRLHTWLLSVPVFVKVMGIALAMAVLLGAGTVWQIHRSFHAHLLRELEDRGQTFVEHLAGHCDEFLGEGRQAELAAHFQHSLEELPDATHIVLEDAQGRVLAEAQSERHTGHGRRVYELTAAPGGGPTRLRTGMCTDRVDEGVDALTRRLLRMALLITLLGIGAAWWLSRAFARPIEELANLARSVQAGHYQVQAPVRARDEVGELATAFNEMAAALRQKEEARQQLLRKVIQAGEEERKRIARELHDHTGQALTSQIAALGALENLCRDPAARPRLTELRQQVEQTLAEVHDLSVTLRPSVLDDLGLVAALQRHCRTFASHFGVSATFGEIGLDHGRLPAEVELTIYRVAQEALTNAVRHGRASRIQVLVQRHAHRVLATIQDNGTGFDVTDWQRRCLAGDHLGLLGIEERVTLLGGEFCVESSAGQGVTVYADLPLQETA